MVTVTMQRPDAPAATLPEKLRAKAWLLLRRREATFEDEAAANLMLRAAKDLEADRG